MSFSDISTKQGRLSEALASLELSGTLMEVDALVVHPPHYWAQMREWSYQQVKNPYWRIYFDRNTGAGVRHAKKSYALSPEKILLIPAGVCYDCFLRNPVDHFWVHFYLPGFGLREFDQPRFIGVDPLMQLLLDQCIECARSLQRRTFDYQAASLVKALIYYVLSRLPSFDFPEAPPSLRSVLKEIHFGPMAGLQVNSMAKESGFSEAHFSRIFKEFFKKAPIRYLMEIRVQRAAVDLISTDDSVEKIAERFGFANRHYFTRVFSSIMGFSPAAYRNQDSIKM